LSRSNRNQPGLSRKELEQVNLFLALFGALTGVALELASTTIMKLRLLALTLVTAYAGTALAHRRLTWSAVRKVVLAAPLVLALMLGLLSVWNVGGAQPDDQWAVQEDQSRSHDGDPRERARALLQERMADKSEMGELLSQLQALRHQTAMSVINNIR
jgi:hypothetical protein